MPDNDDQLIQKIGVAGHPWQTMAVRKLCAMCEEIFQREPMLLETSGPLTVVGNIHGMLGSTIRKLCCDLKIQMNRETGA